jgi:orotidine-5'-phosphate decarboxylase
VTQSARDRVAFALDYPTLAEAQRGAELVAPHVGVLKVGLELFVRSGPEAVRWARSLGCKVFLDLKLCDIPQTVDNAVGSALELGANFLTLHAGGGPKMLEAAASRVQQSGSNLQLLAVTVLTSLDQSDISAFGIAGTPAQHARRLAALAWEANIRGFVCSVEEVLSLRTELGPDAFLVTPGIRPLAPSGDAPSDDQKRVGTPARAIASGSSLLVVGRPIRDAADPAAAARSIVEEVERAEREKATSR